MVTQPLDAVDPGDGERGAESIVSGKGLQATHRHRSGNSSSASWRAGCSQSAWARSRGRQRQVQQKAVFNMGGFRDERQDIHRADC